MQPDLQAIQAIIDAALKEDIGQGDITSALVIPQEAVATLRFIPREILVVCGVQVVERVFHTVDKEVRVTLLVEDGQKVNAATPLIEVSGNARSLLTAERTALNLFQRMCSVATATAQYVEAVAHTRAKILDTRKTMPTLRVLDKYAVRCGGGTNHRMRLDDAMLIKDNHIAVAGSITAAVARAKAGNTQKLSIEVECDTLEQVQEALSAGVDSILLDNMSNALMSAAVKQVAGRVKLEASGNVTLETVGAIAETGVDYISVGRITHSVRNVDIGLDVKL